MGIKEKKGVDTKQKGKLTAESETMFKISLKKIYIEKINHKEIRIIEYGLYLFMCI